MGSGASTCKNLLASLKRIGIALVVIAATVGLALLLWQPGLDVRDGRNDRVQNAIWIGHGWLGADDWFIQYKKTNELERYRSPERIKHLADNLRRHHIRDIYPHVCPATPDGRLPDLDPKQIERFLNEFSGFRVIPWIGGPNGSAVRLTSKRWRDQFVLEVRRMLDRYPAFAGVHLNVEPLPSGDEDFLRLLDELRAKLPNGRMLSVAAYPPPTRWHPSTDVHWQESYFREVARRSDQVAVMTYDAAQRIPKTYQRLMADWTRETLDWSEGKPLLLGIPTYDDAGVSYHEPRVENMTNALLGIHRGLASRPDMTNYQGVAIYCEWETDPSEWAFFREHFLRPAN